MRRRLGGRPHRGADRAGRAAGEGGAGGDATGGGAGGDTTGGGAGSTGEAGAGGGQGGGGSTTTGGLVCSDPADPGDACGCPCCWAVDCANDEPCCESFCASGNGGKGCCGG